MKPSSVRSTREERGLLNGRALDHTMLRHNGDNPESLDPRLEYVDRLLAREAARLMGRAPVGLAERVLSASSGWLPQRQGGMKVAHSQRVAHRPFSFLYGRRAALAACMALLFIGGMWSLRQEGKPAAVNIPQPGGSIVMGGTLPDSFSAFLAPIGDDELADERASTSVLELGDAEYWAVEAELSALQSILQLR